ncbi:MAG: sulfatase [Kiritimatiellia bacterium]|jgi:arylsulfatase A-like enzyme|nr:sulfatase [Kiritimatiellia bacterium]
MTKKLIIILCIGALAGMSYAADRPNILWITCEDISPYLGCYDCPEAQTPNLDRLAERGIRYTRAYANAPVCAVARSTLLTGMYSTTIGTHQMRSYVQLPDSIPAYPRILRKAGYYCTNNSKKDYNSNFSNDKNLWNESSGKAHWKNRKEGQPFFAVFNFTVTHESQLSPNRIKQYVARKQIPPTPRIDPGDIKLPPYHPDLPEMREDWARLHDLITHMDSMAGARLRELEEQGVADNTIVFFYSDHGGMLCRSKRYIYNVGTQVPLIVSFPKKWQHLAPALPGQTSDRLVSFIDLPKTVLSLAGTEVPEQMQGRIFLGTGKEPAPESVHFFRDRMADQYDFSRAVTDGRYYYIQNFMPHRPRGRDTRYGFTVQANWRAWESHYEAGKCDPIQSQFFKPKPTVEFFDTKSDPWHVKNLAGQAEHRERIAMLEKDLEAWMVKTRDTGIIPEAMFSDIAGPDKPFKSLYEYAQSDEYPVVELLKIAKDASLADPKKLSDYLNCMRHSHPVARHYGAYALFLLRSSEDSAKEALREMIDNDAMAANRVMAAQALALCGDPDAAYRALHKEVKATESGYAFLLALNAFRFAHIDDRLTLEDWKTFQSKEIPRRPGHDPNGAGYCNRIIKDAMALWPKRRPVD